MKRLLDIGFKYAGKWLINNDTLEYKLENPSNKINVLYAFIENEKIMYIGKSTRTLNDRMYNYKNSDPSQKTNHRNKSRIKDSLLNGNSVEIYVFIDDGLLSYGNYHINLAAGLEDSLINIIQPEWNDIK